MGQMLKSATSDYDQRHVIAFRPISAAARSWSYDKTKYLLCNIVIPDAMEIWFVSNRTVQYFVKAVPNTDIELVCVYIGVTSVPIL